MMQTKYNLNNLALIFVRPKRVFEDKYLSQSYIIPLSISFIVFLFQYYIVWDIAINDMLTSGNMSSYMMGEKNFDNSEKYIQIISLALATLLFYGICALVVYKVSLYLEGYSSFKTIFSVILWGNIVFTLEIMIETILILTQNTTLGVGTTLSNLVNVFTPLDKESTLNMILSTINVFTFWKIWLWIIGISIVNNFSRKKAFVIFFSLWLVWVVGTHLLNNMYGYKVF